MIALTLGEYTGMIHSLLTNWRVLHELEGRWEDQLARSPAQEPAPRVFDVRRVRSLGRWIWDFESPRSNGGRAEKID
jgi:hypothetical protein